MLSIDQILYTLNKLAQFYAQKSRGRFERDELVNQVWLKGDVQKASDTSSLYRIARCDMIDYMRKHTNNKEMYVSVIHNLSCLPENELENDELIDFLLGGLPRRDRLLVRLCACGYNQKECAEILGLSATWVSFRLNNIIAPHIVRRYHRAKLLIS